MELVPGSMPVQGRGGVDDGAYATPAKVLLPEPVLGTVTPPARVLLRTSAHRPLLKAAAPTTPALPTPVSAVAPTAAEPGSKTIDRFEFVVDDENDPASTAVRKRGRGKAASGRKSTSPRADPPSEGASSVKPKRQRKQKHSEGSKENSQHEQQYDPRYLSKAFSLVTPPTHEKEAALPPEPRWLKARKAIPFATAASPHPVK